MDVDVGHGLPRAGAVLDGDVRAGGAVVPQRDRVDLARGAPEVRVLTVVEVRERPKQRTGPIDVKKGRLKTRGTFFAGTTNTWPGTSGFRFTMARVSPDADT